jgi:hypothetical protein
MPRVFVLNNYSFEEVWEEVHRREKPDHHLYGINHFEQRKFEVEIIPFKSLEFLQNLNNIYRKSPFFIPVGDIDQQWSCLSRLKKADIIYAPCQTQTHFLSYLRALGLIKVPIVCLAHHPLNRGRLARFREPFIKLFVKGTDAFPSLSQAVANEINTLSNKSCESYPLSWGPDADFYPSMPVRGRGVVAAGRTGRDFYTFGMAASQTNAQAHIICLESDVSQSFQMFGKNVQVTVQPNKGYMKYPELLEIYAKARVLAIPLSLGVSLSGLTSLMDALGMGKPVIMTKHPLIDLDIEAEAIGKWVEPGDVNGWKEAIQFFEDNEDEAFAMGQRARNLVMAGLNSVSFANQIVDIFENVLTRVRTLEG